MKTLAKSVLYLALVSICCQSCFKSPEAAFSYEPAENPESGETIEFTNESLDGKDYFWDFGNGETSEEEMPDIKYLLPGTYTVTLIAENLFRSDSISENILINPPTILEFYFFDYDGNPLSIAQVELYNTYSDAMSFTNQLKSGTTNTFGMVKFSHLEAKQYYIWMEKDDNSGGAYLSGGYLGPLTLNEINTYYAFADYYTNKKKKSASAKTLQLFERNKKTPL